MPSVSIATKLLEEGETDFMFYKRHIGFHVIDRAIRFSDGREVTDRFSHTPLYAYTTVWVQRHCTLTENRDLPMRQPLSTSNTSGRRRGYEPQVNMPALLNRDSQCCDMSCI